MATIFDLSIRLLLRLQSLDPYLDNDYDPVLSTIFNILDNDSKTILLTHNLNPKGIFYDETKKSFYHHPAKSFASIIQNKADLNGKLIGIVKQLEKFLANITPPPQQSGHARTHQSQCHRVL